MNILKTKELSDCSTWWVARLALTLVLVILYGWTVFEPYTGDALMHMMDDTQLHSLKDVLRTFYTGSNPAYHEMHRLAVFHRPVFNELYLTGIKNIFGIGSLWIRVMTLTMLVGIALSFLLLMQKLRISPLAATVGTAWLVLSPSLFFGLYEFGLAFSQLLVLLCVLSLLAFKKYIDNRQQTSSKIWSGAALLCTFLAVFTKESAVVWPFISILITLWFAQIARVGSNRKSISTLENIREQIVRLHSIKWLITALIGISVLYFATRYLKLGSLTAIAGGIEQAPSFVDALYKLVGYVLLLLQIPTSIIPPYMSVSIGNMGWFEIIARALLFIAALWALWACWRRSKFAALTMAACFIFAFLPITKVSRNAPNYGDLMSIPLAITLSLGFDAIKEKISRRTFALLSLIIATALVMVSALFASRYVYNTDMWVARSQGYGRSAISDFAAADGAKEAAQIVGASGMYSPEQNWALSHAGVLGSTLIVNLGIQKEKFVANSSKLTKNANILFIDFLPDSIPRRVGAGPFPGYGRLLTAYYPVGISYKAVDISNGTYDIGGLKVVRLSCENTFYKTFNMGFTDVKNVVLNREVDSAMNLNIAPGKMVLEFVAPPNAVKLNLVDNDGSACHNPKVGGYSTDDIPIASHLTTINSSPTFENEVDWKGRFQKGPGGKGVIVGPGADNPNVISQRISIRPFEQIKIVTLVSSATKPSATGRIQINWVGDNDQFISSSIKVIDVSKKEQRFENIVVAPAGAVAGILYVAPHTANDILHYSEMRVLGSNQ